MREQTLAHEYADIDWHSFDEKVWGEGVIIYLRISVPSILEFPSV